VYADLSELESLDVGLCALCNLVLERCGDELRILRVGARASRDTVLEENVPLELRGEGHGGVIGGDGGM